jgi:uncharacterized protein (TIGR02594 family)
MLEKTNPVLLALSFYGETPIDGPKDNKQIVEFLESCGYPASTHDEVPWCSAFLVWCFKQCGIETPANAAAISWLEFGTQTDQPKLGDIVVFGWPTLNPIHHHVGFFIRETLNGLYVLAGNQDNTVDIALWRNRSVLSYRRY